MPIYDILHCQYLTYCTVVTTLALALSLESAEKDAETLDWLSIPADQRIIDDKTLEWVADVPGLFGTDDKLECEEREHGA